MLVKPRNLLRRQELKPEERTDLYRTLFHSEMGQAVLADLQEVYKHRKYLHFMVPGNETLLVYHAAKADLITEIENVLIGLAPKIEQDYD